MLNRTLIYKPTRLSNISGNLARLKILAIIAMLLDHLAFTYLQLHPNPDWALFIRMPGRISIPIFAFLVAYGYENFSTDRRRFALRLWLFAALSEPAFIAFTGHAGNALFPLAIGVTSLVIADEATGRAATFVPLLIIFFIGIFSWITKDASVVVISLLVLAFHRPVRDGWWAIWVFPILFLIFMCNKWEWQTIAMIPVTLGIIVTALRMPIPSPAYRIGKWWSYGFYPVHLAILATAIHLGG